MAEQAPDDRESKTSNENEAAGFLDCNATARAGKARKEIRSRFPFAIALLQKLTASRAEMRVHGKTPNGPELSHAGTKLVNLQRERHPALAPVNG